MMGISSQQIPFSPNLFLDVNMGAEHKHSYGSLLEPIIWGVEWKYS
jgi:hypothetical protein